MWTIIGLSLLLLVLFYLIGYLADWVISNVKKIGNSLGIKNVWLGLLLGLLTSMPELLVGLQSMLRGTTPIAYGDLVGGIVVLLGLVAGLNAIVLGKLEIEKSFSRQDIVFIAVFLGLPVWLAVDGQISWLDGLLMITWYGLLVFHLVQRGSKFKTTIRVESESGNFKLVLYTILGLAGLVVLSSFIMDTALSIMTLLNLPQLLIGLLIFSLGTNLPELTLAVKSWQKQARDLSLGNLMGSAMANVIVLGVLSLLRPLLVNLGGMFIFLASAFLLLQVFFIWFSDNDGAISRQEGIWLVVIYLLFSGGLLMEGLL